MSEEQKNTEEKVTVTTETTKEHHKADEKGSASTGEGQSITDLLNQLEKFLDEYLGKKAPQLPVNVKEILVKIIPIFSIIGIIVSIFYIAVAAGLSALVSALSFIATSGISAANYWWYLLALIPIVVLQVMALPGLFARSKMGWKYSYWAVVVGAFYSLISFNFPGLVIGTGVSLYIWFQIKSYYKN